ncbi:MAG: hypothetical protein K0Q91_1542 [Fibrobacteria bacterium]|jgi:hypothetical protein|nr:hypothetical protein [Fibrobacteria bacterium]
MKRFFLLAGASCVLAFTGCVFDPFTSPAETRTQILSAREIHMRPDSMFYNPDLLGSSTFGFQVVPGARDLFEYHHKAADKIGLADDEFSESLFFLVDKGTRELTMDSASFAHHRVLYVPHSFSPAKYGVIDRGTIRVVRTGVGRYFVEADVSYELRYLEDSLQTGRGHLKFKQNFKF